MTRGSRLLAPTPLSPLNTSLPQVVAVLTSAGMDALDAFALRWRSHFVNTLAPRFLPVGWDVARPLQAK